MINRSLSVLLAISLIFIFSLSIVLVVSNHETRVISYSQEITGNTVSEPQKNSMQLAYDKSSNDNIGVLIKTNELDKVSAQLESKGAHTNKHKIGRVISANIPANQIDSLANDPSLEVLPNRIVQAFSIDVSETNAEKFWNNGFTGNGIKVAVLDTGVNSDKVVSSQDFTGSGTTDENGHGTKISEIILAIAPNIQLINAKVLDKNGFGSEASVIAGINYAVEQNADIISLSLGGLFNDVNSPLVAAVEDAISKGVTVIIAAGNCGTDLCNGFKGVATPGNSPNAITVGSVSGESVVPYSSGQDFGSYIKPDVVAPESANSLTGTSASTPFVTGAAALIIEKYKSNPLQVKSLIEQNAKDLGISGKDIVFGSGKLNLDFITEIQEENEIEFEQGTSSNNNNVVQAFESQTEIKVKTHPTWNVLNAWNANYQKYNLDVLDENFFIITGTKSQNYSSVLIWDGTKWIGNNGTTSESMYAVDIYNRTFAVIGGMIKPTGTSSVAYVWNGANLNKYLLLNNTNVNIHSKIIDVKVKSPAEAYALESNGLIFKYNGATWSNISNKIGSVDSKMEVMTSLNGNILDENNVVLGFNRSVYWPRNEIFYFNGIKWTNTTIPSFAYNCDLKKVQLLTPNTGYAICGKYMLKWNGADWKLDYNSTSELNDFSFSDTDFGFIASSNNTMIKWNGIKWMNKTYVGGDITQISWCRQKFDFERIYLANRNEGYAAGDCSGELSSNFVWNGVDWKYETVNFTKPIPAGLHPDDLGTDTLRLIPMKFAKGNDGVYALGYSELKAAVYPPSFGIDCMLGIGSCLGYDVAIMKVKKTLTFNLPSQNINVDGTADLDMSLYTETNKTVTYSVIQEDASKVDCSISTNTLTVTGKNGFKGVGLCRIKADTDDNSAVSDAEIYVGMLPTTLDLSVGSGDISFDNSGNPLINIHSVAGIGDIDFDLTLAEVEGTSMKGKNTVRISSFDTNQETNTVNPSFSITRGNKIEVVVDSGNEISENSKLNNKAVATYGMIDVYLNITVESAFVAPIIEYLQGELMNYNIVSSLSDAEHVINIGYNIGSTTLGCKNGVLYNRGITENRPHTGIIFTTNNGRTVTNVCGAGIPGLVNAIRMLNKKNLNDNKEYVFTSSNTAAISTLDFMKTQGTVTADVVSRALYGGLSEQDKIVRASDGTYLRLKNYKPFVSQSFLDYLLGIDSSKPWLEPVIMAGGLWSDINAWDEAGREISSGVEDGMFTDSVKYVPRDVYLIELTGGPGTECDTCSDYTYGDVYGKYWPALVGGALKLSGKSQAAYVGHSNGGRVALDALKNFSSGKSNAGFLSDGTSFNLPSNAVDTYIGVGVPGAFEGSSPFSDCMKKYGEQAKHNLESRSIKHVSGTDLGTSFLKALPFSDLYCNLILSALTSNNKISFNVVSTYYQLINSTSDSQPSISIPNGAIIAGTRDLNTNTDSDFVVSTLDEKAIANNIFGTLINHYFEYNLAHIAINIGPKPTGLTNGHESRTMIKKILGG